MYVQSYASTSVQATSFTGNLASSLGSALYTVSSGKLDVQAASFQPDYSTCVRRGWRRMGSVVCCLPVGCCLTGGAVTLCRVLGEHSPAPHSDLSTAYLLACLR